MNAWFDKQLDRLTHQLDRIGAVWFFCYFAFALGLMLWLIFGSTAHAQRVTEPSQLRVRWLQSPMTISVYNYSTNGYTTESLYESYRDSDTSVRIGLRSDGVVVWSTRKELQK